MSKAKTSATPKQCKKSCCTDSESWVFILKEFEAFNKEDSKAAIVDLRHPRLESASLFLFSPGNKTVQEILVFDNDKPRSLFLDDEVQSNGKIYLTTPVDPLFLALPYLKKYGKCSPLDQMITDEEFPETERLLECSNLIKYIHQIADQKGDESLNAYAYNEEKTLKWLEKKVRRVANAVKEKGIHVASNSAISANFVVAKDPEDDKDAYLRYALGIVSNYLPDSLTTSLESHLGLPPLESEKKRKSATESVATPSSKKTKIEEEYQSPSPAPSKEKKSTPSAKEKAMAKAASGSKNIMSFFKKK